MEISSFFKIFFLNIFVGHTFLLDSNVNYECVIEHRLIYLLGLADNFMSNIVRRTEMKIIQSSEITGSTMPLLASCTG